MKAVVYKGPRKVAVEDVPDAKIEAPGDVVVRITTAAICGSDLHMYEGRSPSDAGIVFGHENLGIVEEIGPGVQSIKRGDRVVLPFNIACGFCFNCVRGYTNACLTTNPTNAGAGYGYAGMGPYRGGQAEFLRVPFADFNCLKLPGAENDDFEDDFVLLADIFPTAWHATALAHVKAGDTVAVFGAGPVGLLSAYSAILKGAVEVYVVDRSEDRLEKAKSIGAIPVNFAHGDPAEQILELRRKDGKLIGAMRPEEREKMPGVMCVIDAVGYQAHGDSNPDQEDAPQLMKQIAKVINPTGKLGIIGVWFPNDPGATNLSAKHGEFLLPFGQLWEKGVEIGTGQAIVKRYNVALRDMIITGRAKPGFIVSHHIPLAHAAEAYEKFDMRGTGKGAEYSKILLKPVMDGH
jgi:glutathione-independent formaldehyde dehydrogenase